MDGINFGGNGLGGGGNGGNSQSGENGENGEIVQAAGKSDKGKFIVIEGLDGSGKTTIANLLQEHFAAKNVASVLTKEPTDNLIGKLIRNVLSGGVYLPIESLALLFAADRAEHIIRQISPALCEKTHVICDRFIYSSMAYQGRDLPIKTILQYNQPWLIVPDVTIFIDTDPAECMHRIATTRTHTDIYERPKYAKDIRRRYFEAFDLCAGFMPVSVVDGNCSVEGVLAGVLGVLAG
ncbi:MAG: dTMP kinase [Defluviitaleaceae bacterium]|nr:dTMP kinase [Defluviitaleaceae bacterium]